MKNCLLFLLLAFQLQGTIFETAHFCEIESHVGPDTLILLDIDDTLLIPKQMLGCDEWFMHRCRQHQESGLSKSDALEAAIAEWEAVRHLTKMEIVEVGSEKIVQSMQEKGLCVMGLTTQGLALATRTVQQLQEQQLDLSKTAPTQEDHCISIGGHTVLFREGILFTSGRSKGESLFKFCEKIGWWPKRIVFINDKEAHLRDIERAAEARGVEFVGLRYGYSDTRKKAFRPDVAHFQFAHSSFLHLLSDEEALAQME